MEQEFTGQPYSENSGQWLEVRMEISDKWCLSGVNFGTNVFINDIVSDINDRVSLQEVCR